MWQLLGRSAGKEKPQQTVLMRLVLESIKGNMALSGYAEDSEQARRVRFGNCLVGLGNERIDMDVYFFKLRSRRNAGNARRKGITALTLIFSLQPELRVGCVFRDMGRCLL
jgi:hypothetical protein